MDPIPTILESDDDYASLGGILVTSIAAIVGVSCSLSSSWLAKVTKAVFSFKNLSSMFSCLNNATRFFKSCLGLLKRIFKKIAISTGLMAPDFFLDENSEEIKKWSQEVDLLCDVRCTEPLKTISHFKERFWCAVAKGHGYTSRLVTNDGRLTGIQTALRAQIARLNKRAAELSRALLSAPVRYEPFVFQLTGATNIGKSYVTNDIITSLLESVNVRSTGDPIFVRTPGNAYWNGLADHAAVVYDDWLAVKGEQFADQQIGELFALKSVAVFNPNMAAIEDKETRANPLLVCLCSNKDFPDLPSSNTPEAVYRRRDVMIRPQIKEAYRGTPIREIATEVLEVFDHLEFYFAESTSNRNTSYNGPHSYKEMTDKLIELFKAYHEREKLNVARRIKQLNRLLPEYVAKLDPATDISKLLFRDFSEMCAEIVQPINQNSPSIQDWKDWTAEQVAKLKRKFLTDPLAVMRAYMPNYTLPWNRPRLELDDYRLLDRDLLEFRLVQLNELYNSQTLGTIDARQIRDQIVNSYRAIAATPDSRNTELSNQVTQMCNILIPTTSSSSQIGFLYGFSTLTDYLSKTNLGAYRQLWIGEESVTRCDICMRDVCTHDECDENTCLHDPDLIGKRTVQNGMLCVNSLVDCVHYRCGVCDVMQRNLGDGTTDCGVCRGAMRKATAPTRMYKFLHAISPALVPFEYLMSGARPVLSCITNALRHDIVRQIDSVVSGLVVGAAIHMLTVLSLLWGVEKWCSYLTTTSQNNPEPETLPHLAPHTYAENAQLDPICNYCHRVAPAVDHACNELQVSCSVCGNTYLKRDTGTHIRACIERCKLKPNIVRDSECDPSCDWNCNDETTFCLWSMFTESRWHTTPNPINSCLHPDVAALYDYCSDPAFNWDDVSYVDNTFLMIRNGRVEQLLIDTPCNNDSCSYFKFRTPLCKAYIKNKISVYAVDYTQRNLTSLLPDLAPKISLILSPHSTIVHSQTTTITAVPWYKRLGAKIMEYWDTLKLAGAVLGAIGVVWGTCRLFTSLFSSAPVASEIIASGSTATQRAPRSIVRVQRPGVVSQGPLSPILSRVIFNTTYVRIFDPSSNKQILMKGVGVFGRMFAFNRHYWLTLHYNMKKYPTSKIQIASKQTISPKGEILWVDWTPKMIADFDPYDCVLCEAAPSTPFFKDISKHLISETQYHTIRKTMTFVEVDVNMTYCTSVAVTKFVENLKCSTPGLEIDGKPHTYSPPMSIEYDYGRPGACGSVIFDEGSENSPIVGMHFAGRAVSATLHVGYALPLCKEWFIKFKPSISDTAVGALSQSTQTKFSPEADICPISSVPKELVPFIPNKTSIIPSAIVGIIDTTPKTAPAVLDYADPRYPKPNPTPLQAGVKKNGKIPGAFKEETVNFVREKLTNLLLSKCRPVLADVGVLPVKEAVLGIPGADFYDPLNLSTSAGWPFCQVQGGSRKSYWLTVPEDRSDVEIHPDLAEVLETKDALRKQGIVPLSVYMDCLKDERLPLEKIPIPGKTRVFSLSPLDLTIQKRQYFQPFIAAFMSNRHDLCHAVGIAADGPEWTRIYDALASKSDKVCCMDYSGFGPSLSSQIQLEVVLPAIKAWFARYTTRGEVEVDNLVRSVMMTESANSVHICKDLLYQTLCGSPSGDIFTTPVNSLVNLSYVLAAWFEIFKGTENVDKFFELCTFYCYGDDAIFTTQDLHLQFNCKTISEHLAKYNVTLTDATKSGTRPWCSFAEASFLKRGFLDHPTRPGEKLAPLDWNSVNDCALWVWKSAASLEESTRVNAHASILLAYAHGPTKFQKWKNRVNAALHRCKIDEINITWEELDSMFFDTRTIISQSPILLLPQSRSEELMHFSTEEYTSFVGSQDDWTAYICAPVHSRLTKIARSLKSLSSSASR